MKKSLVIFALALLISAFFTFTCTAQDVLTGEYELVSMSYDGTEMDPGSVGVSASLLLKEDGTGMMIMNGGENELPKWTAGEGSLTIYNSNGDPLECVYTDGIVSLEMGDNYFWYFYHESVNPNAGKEASLISKVFEKIDAAEGAHLSYEFHSDFMDSTTIIDAHAKRESYFSLKTVKAYGSESTDASCYYEGSVYLLDPAKKTGKSVMSVSLEMLGNNVLMLDDLYQTMYLNAKRKDFTVEERELDGEKFTAEVFPASLASSGIAFYFDAEGNLIHALEDAPEAMPSMGETFYTIHSFDKSVDGSLFDISGYTIE